ncbi:MAG TPA: type 4a pilus biogenesis protein PilO [Candidatus Omnitrophota bacterium]|nr:type 4a pilus biogenesis protein PilO [Candidatus Omnitrophota bacterium]
MMKPASKFTISRIIEIVKGVDKKAWVWIASGAVAFVALWVLIIGPAWFDRPRLRSEMRGMEAQIRQVKALNQRRPVFEADEKLFGGVITGVQKSLFSSEEIGSLMGQFSRLANEAGVEVLASKPQNELITFEAPYNAKYGAVGYEFTLQGGYHDLGKLMSLIEGAQKLLRVRSFHVVATDKTPDKHIAELRLLAITAASPGAVTDKTNAKK